MEIVVPEGTLADDTLPDNVLSKTLGPGKHRLPLTSKQQKTAHNLTAAGKPVEQGGRL